MCRSKKLKMFRSTFEPITIEIHHEDPEHYANQISLEANSEQSTINNFLWLLSMRQTKNLLLLTKK